MAFRFTGGLAALESLRQKTVFTYMSGKEHVLAKIKCIGQPSRFIIMPKVCGIDACAIVRWVNKTPDYDNWAGLLCFSGGFPDYWARYGDPKSPYRNPIELDGRILYDNGWEGDQGSSGGVLITGSTPLTLKFNTKCKVCKEDFPYMDPNGPMAKTGRCFGCRGKYI